VLAICERKWHLRAEQSCYLLVILVGGNADSLQFILANILVSGLSSCEHISSAVFQTKRDIARVVFAPQPKVYTMK